MAGYRASECEEHMLKQLAFFLWSVVACLGAVVQNSAKLTPVAYNTEIGNQQVHVTRSFHVLREKVPMHT